MQMYKCEWPNGDVSFVLASDVDDAVYQLDEFGEVEPRMLSKISAFMIDLSPDRKILETNEKSRKEGRDEGDWPWKLNEVGECMSDPASRILPSEEAALRRIRRFEKEAKIYAREQELRKRAERDGTLVDLTARRMADAMKGMGGPFGAEPLDER